MASTSRDRTKQPEPPLVLSGSASRRLPLRILFVHRDVADVEDAYKSSGGPLSGSLRT